MAADCWKGAVFPIAGEYQPFRDTWGACRGENCSRTHKGTDITAATGTPLVAVMDGTLRLGSSGLGGLDATLSTSCGDFYYGHMSRQEKQLQGQRVAKGTVIGAVGSTGNSDGPHLHFGWLRTGVHQNPYTMLASVAKSGGAQGVPGAGGGISVTIPGTGITVGVPDPVGFATDPVLDAVGAVAQLPGVQAITELAKAGLAAAAWLQDRSNWLRILQVIAAAGLVVGALVLLFGKRLAGGAGKAAAIIPHPAAKAAGAVAGAVS